MRKWDFAYEDYPETPDYQCLECGWLWVPEGVWEQDGDEYGPCLVFVPEHDQRECGHCGSEDVDEFAGTWREAATRYKGQEAQEASAEALYEQRIERGER